MKVGRAALDEEAIRIIERSNPDIEFDWTRILKEQGVPRTDSRPLAQQAAQTKRRHDRDIHAKGARPAPKGEAHPARRAPDSAEPPVSSAESLEHHPAGGDAPLGMRHDDQLDAPVAGAGRDVEAGPEPCAADPDTGPPLVSQTPAAAEARLGVEGVLRLRARHAEILARITEKVADPVRREELKTQADRLNPDTWVTQQEVTDGLEQYEAVFAGLRGIVGRRRRRPRRGGRAAGVGPAPPATETNTVEHEPQDPDDDPAPGSRTPDPGADES